MTFSKYRETQEISYSYASLIDEQQSGVCGTIPSNHFPSSLKNFIDEFATNVGEDRIEFPCTQNVTLSVSRFFLTRLI
jgi:hypothetical protein